MIVDFVVTRARVQHPSIRGQMVERGYRLSLDPERYPEHAALAARLERHGGWSRSDASASPVQGPQPATTSSDKLLPHQAAAVEEIRNKFKRS